MTAPAKLRKDRARETSKPAKRSGLAANVFAAVSTFEHATTSGGPDELGQGALGFGRKLVREIE